jgi:hypothetical protein
MGKPSYSALRLAASVVCVSLDTDVIRMTE